MKNDFFKKDLVKVLSLMAIFILSLLLLRYWDQKSGILEEIAKKYF